MKFFARRKPLIRRVFQGSLALLFLSLSVANSPANLIDLIKGSGVDNTAPQGKEEFAAYDSAAYQLLYRGDQDFAAGKTGASIKSFNRLLKKYPLSSHAPKAQFLLSEALLSEGKLESAFSSYQTLLERFKQSPDYQKTIDRQYEIAQTAQGKYRKSFIGIPVKVQNSKIIEMYQSIISNAPYTKYAPLAQFGIAEVYADTGKEQSAIAAYQKVVDDYPRSKLKRQAKFRIGELNNMAALDSEDDRNLNKARESLKSYALENPKDKRSSQANQMVSEIEERQARKAYDVAKFYEQSGKREAAQIYYREAARFSQSKAGAAAQKQLKRMQKTPPPQSALQHSENNGRSEIQSPSNKKTVTGITSKLKSGLGSLTRLAGSAIPASRNANH